MDFKQSTEYRYGRLETLNNLGDNKYDYQTNGVLTKSLPKILFKGNSVIVAFLQLIDMEIIYLLKTIEKIQKFKVISRY